MSAVAKLEWPAFRGRSFLLSLQPACSLLALCHPLEASTITARLQSWGLDNCLNFDSPTFLPAFLQQTHTQTYLFVQLHFCKHQYAHQLNPHACTHRQKLQALTHTQMQARIRGSHGGWCAVLCSRIGSSASCELDSPGSVLIPATLFTSPHIYAHTHSSPGPSPAEGFTKFDLFVCSSLSSLSFFLFLFYFCLVHTRVRLSPCGVHTSQRPLWKVPSISPVSSHARQERVDRRVCPWLVETCKPALCWGEVE